MCEEVKNPSVQVPRAMVGTVILNTLAGLLFLIPICFVLPDIQMLVALKSGQPIPTIFKAAVGSSGGAIALLLPLMVLAILCGIGCTTAASRCTWAFARDGAIPGAKWWMQINHKLDVPFNAMMLSMVVQILLGLLWFGSTQAFNAFSGVGVMCLTASYATPIAISLFTGRKQVRTGKFYLGTLGAVCNVVAIGKPFLHSQSLPTSLLTPSSLVAPCSSALLHALFRPHHARISKLRASRLRHLHCHLWPLVLGLGLQQLCWPPHT